MKKLLNDCNSDFAVTKWYTQRIQNQIQTVYKHLLKGLFFTSLNFSYNDETPMIHKYPNSTICNYIFSFHFQECRTSYPPYKSTWLIDICDIRYIFFLLVGKLNTFCTYKFRYFYTLLKKMLFLFNMVDVYNTCSI